MFRRPAKRGSCQRRMVLPESPRRQVYSSPVRRAKSMELARNLKIESVSRLQPTKPLTLDRQSPVSAAVGMMRENRVGCLLITDAKKLAGVFTERDLLRRVIAAGQPLDTPVGTVMTSGPVTVTAQEPIRNAIQKMETGGYRHLPVVDAN